MSNTATQDKVVDHEGVEIRVGQQVKYGEETGTVHIVAGPGERQHAEVVVKFDEGDYEEFETEPINLRYPGDYDGWKCSDLVVCDCPACGGSGVRCCEFGADS